MKHINNHYFRRRGIETPFFILMLLFSGVSISSQQIGEVVFSRVVTEEASFRVVRLAGDLNYPWALAFMPDGSFLVTERPGRLLHLDTRGVRREIQGLPRVVASGQGGLLDLVLHPDFDSNQLIYFTYAAPGPGGSSTALARARLSEFRLMDFQVLWTMEKRTTAGQHYGSRLVFDSKGFLYMTTGERGDSSRARDPSDSAGKVLRFREDGSVPADNPFVNRAGYLPEIFSLGHRNPQGLALRPGTGQIWLTEHGPRGGDEINLVKRGADYGWPVTTYGVAYSGARIAESPTAPGIEPPVHHWTPSIAPSGLAFYNGKAFSFWEGNLLSGSLAGKQLVRVILEGDSFRREEVLIRDTLGRLRDVRVGPEGLVYLLTDSPKGELLRLEPLP